MNRLDVAKKYGLTVEQLRDEKMAWLNCEGYDDDGNEYETLHDWLMRRPNVNLCNESEAAILACEQGVICGAQAGGQDG